MIKCIILPECDDYNRGDQALVWESKNFLESTGYICDFKLISSSNNFQQTMKKGIRILKPIIEHPSRKVSDKNNLKYNYLVYLKWGTVALLDFLKNIWLLIPLINKIVINLFNVDKRVTFNQIKNCDILIVKGGGFIHSDGGLSSTYKIFYLLFHINIAISLKKKVIFMPNSFGPLKGPLVKHMVKYTLSKAQLIMSRESLSQTYLKNELGIDTKLYPDLAFYLRKSYINFSFITDKIKVGITVRPYRFKEYSNNENLYANYINSISSFICWLKQNGFEPILIEHTYSVNFHEQDIKAIQDVLYKIEDFKPIVFSNNDLNCEELKYIYSQLDYIVGTRFHSYIFSISEGKMGIAISYGGNKGKGIMKDLGLEEYCIDISEISENILIDKFNNLLNNKVYVEKKLSALNEYLAKEKNIMIADLKKIIE